MAAWTTPNEYSTEHMSEWIKWPQSWAHSYVMDGLCPLCSKVQAQLLQRNEVRVDLLQ